MSKNNLIEQIAVENLRAGHFKDIEWIVKSSGKEVSRGMVQKSSVARKYTEKLRPIYRIYSMTKPIVSFAALRAIEMQKIHLYDKVESYIASFRDRKVLEADGSLKKSLQPITVEHLLTHRSGLSYGFNRKCIVGKYYARDCLIRNARLSLKDFVNCIAEYPLAFQPGSQWRYSLSTDVLAHLLELVFDDDIEKIITKLVLSPLEMIDTKYFVPQKNVNRLMSIYGEPDLDKVTEEQTPETKLKKAVLDDFYPYEKEIYKARGGHGLFSTLDDYSKFAEMLLTGEDRSGRPMISKTMLKFALKNRIQNDQIPIVIDQTPHYGYGWNLIGRIMVNNDEGLIAGNNGEFGWSGAASTYFWVDPELKVSGVVMSQVLGSTIPLGENIRAGSYTLV